MSGWERFLFVRHAETALSGTFCGHTDPPLNECGREQAAALAGELRGRRIEVMYSSDLKRAAMTAASIGADRDMEVELRTGLREMFFGEWEGLRWEEIEARDEAYATRWVAVYPELPAPAGESWPAFQARVLGEVEMLLGMADGRYAVVVAHAGVLRVVLQAMCGMSDEAAWERTRMPCCQVEGAEVLG